VRIRVEKILTGSKRRYEAVPCGSFREGREGGGAKREDRLWGWPNFQSFLGSCNAHHRLLVVAPDTIANITYNYQASFPDLQFPEA
jgi:hypothetical protein